GTSAATGDEMNSGTHYRVSGLSYQQVLCMPIRRSGCRKRFFLHRRCRLQRAWSYRCHRVFSASMIPSSDATRSSGRHSPQLQEARMNISHIVDLDEVSRNGKEASETPPELLL